MKYTIYKYSIIQIKRKNIEIYPNIIGNSFMHLETYHVSRATKEIQGRGKKIDEEGAKEEGTRDGRHEAKGRGRALDAAWWFRIDLPCSRLFRRFYREPRRSSPRGKIPWGKEGTVSTPLCDPTLWRIKGVVGVGCFSRHIKHHVDFVRFFFFARVSNSKKVNRREGGGGGDEDISCKLKHPFRAKNS